MILLPIAALMVGLIFLYLRYPNYREFELSTAEFFPKTTKPPATTLRLRTLFLSLPFYVQLFVFILALAALIFWLSPPQAAEGVPSVGVLILLDTSASMTTLQPMTTANNGKTRFMQGLTLLRELTDHLNSLPEDLHICVVLERFDLVIELVTSAETRSEINTLVDQASQLNRQFEQRILGTDLNLVAQRIRRTFVPPTQLPVSEVSTGCQFTHVAVITDRPSPDWVSEFEESAHLFWLNVGESVDNTGIGSVTVEGSKCLQTDRNISISLVSYGTPPSNSELIISSNDGSWSESRPVNWIQQSEYTFELPASGEYTIVLTPPGNYLHDDQVTIAVNIQNQLQVYWGMINQDGAPLLNAQSVTDGADLQIIPYSRQVDPPSIPTLYIGNGYQSSTTGTVLQYFVEDSPLLDEINLDSTELLHVDGINLDLDPSLNAILMDSNGRALIAASPSHAPVRYAVIPGLPNFGTTDLNEFRLSSVVFLNAVCWVLENRIISPLYTLTSIEQPFPIGTVSTLHPDEGDTQSIGASTTAIQTLQPVRAEVPYPLWLAVTMLVALLMGVERLLAVTFRSRWR